MSAPNNDIQASSPNSSVIIVASNAVDGLRTIFKDATNNGAATEADQGQAVTYASGMTRKQWIEVLDSSSVLKAWKPQSMGTRMQVNHAPCAALALEATPPTSEAEILPEFEIADDTYVDSRESKTSLERELTLKAFSETSVRTGLSGGAADLGFGLSGGVSRQGENNESKHQQTTNTAIHGFYNFPRVIIHLSPDYLELSPQCRRFFKQHGHKLLDSDTIDATYKMFVDRFGTVLSSRVTLGGRLCTTKELSNKDEADVFSARKALETNLTAKVTAAGVGIESGFKRGTAMEGENSENQMVELNRMKLETQGGNGLLASSIPDWTASVGSYRYWRAIQQEQQWDLPSFLKELRGLDLDALLKKQIDALIQHANVDRRRPERLCIHAESNGITKRHKDSASQTLKATISIDYPSIIKTVAFITAEIPPYGLEKPKPSIFFDEGEIKRQMSFELDIHEKNTYEPGRILPKTAKGYGCYIAIRLKPFMIYHPRYETKFIRGHKYALLKWLNIEEKTSMTEELLLDISRGDQQLNSLNPYGALDGPFQANTTTWSQCEQPPKAETQTPEAEQTPKDEVEHSQPQPSSTEDSTSDNESKGLRGYVKSLVSRKDQQKDG